MTPKLRLCVNTQTPLVRFKLGYADLRDKYGYSGGPMSLDRLERGTDYEYTPGGVTGMVHAALDRMQARGMISDPTWVSLGVGAPREVIAGRIRICNVDLEEDKLLLYTAFKEGIWREIHGLGELAFEPGQYQAYVEYNWMSSKVMLEMLPDTDIYWVHDFQQLLVGTMIGPSAPAVCRWHVPFRLERASERLRALIVKGVDGFDSIIVSTKRDLEGLIQAGYRGRAHAIYPYLNMSRVSTPSRRLVAATRAKFGLRPDDAIALVVARMDPVKNQDLAIKALSTLRNERPSLKLVLVGDGSFTSSSGGGLGHSKGRLWNAHLRRLISKQRLADRVVLTGHVSDEELSCLYSTCQVVLVPSQIEGFNLTAAEGWLRKKPCIVSEGAGISELVQDGVNGFRLPPGDVSALAGRLRTLLRSPESAAKMGENGFMTSRLCSIDAAVESLKEAFESVLKLY